MNKTKKAHIIGYRQDILESIELFNIIIDELNEELNNEQLSIDNLSEYPQFESRVSEMEDLLSYIEDIIDKFEKARESLNEALDLIDLI